MTTLRGQYLHLSVFYVNFVCLEYFWSVSTGPHFNIWNPVYFVFETVFISVDRSLNWLVLEVSMQSLSPDENSSIVSIGFDYISPGSCVPLPTTQEKTRHKDITRWSTPNAD